LAKNFKPPAPEPVAQICNLPYRALHLADVYDRLCYSHHDPEVRVFPSIFVRLKSLGRLTGASQVRLVPISLDIVPCSSDIPFQLSMEAKDKCVRDFLDHLATERAASIYTQRNYKQALTEFSEWHQDEQKAVP